MLFLVIGSNMNMTFFDISGNQMPSPYLGSTSQVYPSHQSAPSSSSKSSSRFCSRVLNSDPYSLAPFLGRTRPQSWPDPYEDLGAGKFSQFMGPSNQLGNPSVVVKVKILIFSSPLIPYRSRAKPLGIFHSTPTTIL